MSDERNRHHLAVQSGDVRRWILEVPAVTSTTAGHRRETADLHATVHGCLSAVFEPETVAYELEAHDRPVPDVRERTFDGVDSDAIVAGETTWTPGDGARSRLAAALADACPTGQCRVYRVETTGRTRVTLADGDHWLDGTDTGRVREYERDRQVGDPTNDPFFTRLRYQKGFGDEGDVDDVHYELSLYTYTDIWAAETDLGRRNYDRLERAFERLRDALDVASVRHSFDRDHRLGRDLAAVLEAGD